jgi:radical SAM/Cys-rich protein
MAADPQEVMRNLERLGVRISEPKSPRFSGSDQLRLLQEIEVACADGSPAEFDRSLHESGWETLRPAKLDVFQINVGRLCNMGCKHCHVGAGPDRVDQVMSKATIDAALAALDKTEAGTVDITGGAPELNPHFEYLIERSRARGKHVIFRCNFTCLVLPAFAELPGFLAENRVEVVGSLPHYRKRNTDTVRGEGVFEKSVDAMRLLNEVGYGTGDPQRVLTLMSNPAGAFLAASQPALEREWKASLEKSEGVTFDRLIVLNNMPIGRFLKWLERSGNGNTYLAKLTGAFNPATIAGLMCRNTVSVDYAGRVYDCDFNQMLELPALYEDGTEITVENLDLERFTKRRIQTALHCFGCTAGQGSSCGGALAE